MLLSKLIMVSDYSIKLNSINSTSDVTYCHYSDGHYLIIDKTIHEADAIVNFMFPPNLSQSNAISWGIFFVKKGSNDGYLLGLNKQGKSKLIKFGNAAHNRVLLDLTIEHLSYVLSQFTAIQFSSKIGLPDVYWHKNVSMAESSVFSDLDIVSYGDKLWCVMSKNDVEWIDINNIGYTVTEVHKNRDSIFWESQPIRDFLMRDIPDRTIEKYECSNIPTIKNEVERSIYYGNR